MADNWVVTVQQGGRTTTKDWEKIARPLIEEADRERVDDATLLQRVINKTRLSLSTAIRLVADVRK